MLLYRSIFFWFSSASEALMRADEPEHWERIWETTETEQQVYCDAPVMQTSITTPRRPTSLSLLGELEQPGTAGSVERAVLTKLCRPSVCFWALVAVSAYKVRFMHAITCEGAQSTTRAAWTRHALACSCPSHHAEKPISKLQRGFERSVT